MTWSQSWWHEQSSIVGWKRCHGLRQLSLCPAPIHLSTSLAPPQPSPLLHSTVHCHLHLEIWTTLCNCNAPSTGTQCKIHFSPIVKTALPPPQWPVVKGLQQEELIVNRSILSIFQVKSLWFKTREKKWGSQNLTKVETGDYVIEETMCY